LRKDERKDEKKGVRKDEKKGVRKDEKKGVRKDEKKGVRKDEKKDLPSANYRQPSPMQEHLLTKESQEMSFKKLLDSQTNK
jgi:hypothetical protein